METWAVGLIVAGLVECEQRQFAALAKRLGTEEAATARMDEVAKGFLAAGGAVVDTEMFIYAAGICIQTLRRNVLEPASAPDVAGEAQ